MTLSEQIKTVRLKKDMTQEQVAASLFVTRQTISRWETGATIPPLNALYDLADLYQLSISELLGEKTIMKRKINVLAVIGSLVLNFFFLSTFGMVLASFWLSAWIIDIAFIISPGILFAVNITGFQAFSWDQTGYAILLLVVGLIAFWPLKKISIFLYQATKHYFRYNLNSTYYVGTENN